MELIDEFEINETLKCRNIEITISLTVLMLQELSYDYTSSSRNEVISTKKFTFDIMGFYLDRKKWYLKHSFVLNFVLLGLSSEHC